MKKFFLLFLLLCLIAILLAIFGNLGGRDKISAFGEGVEETNIIYIGVYEPLTGDNAMGGQGEVLGLRYANSVLPTVELAGTSYELRLIETDSAGNKPGDAPAAEELAALKVSAVLGSYSALETAAGLPVFTNNGIPLVGVSCASSAATEGVSDYFRLCGADVLQSSVMANLAESMELRHAAVLTQTGDEYSKKAGRGFAAAFKALGGKATEFSFQLGQQNFRALVTEIRNSGADFVYMLSGAPEAAYFIRQAWEEGLNCPLMGPESWDSPLLLEEGGNGSKSVYFPSDFHSGERADPVSAEFASRFSAWLSADEARLTLNGGNDYTSAASALAYDGYMLVVQAIRNAGSAEPSAVSAALSTASFQGVTGTLVFNEQGESVRKQMLIKTIDRKTGQFAVLQTSAVGG